MNSQPLVSCIMPTYNRRRFLLHSIKWFLRQDYPNCELLIVDDGTDQISDCVPADKRIRYIRLDQKLSIGAKRNLACEKTHGDLIMHWDDDDWMASNRISYQVTMLMREGGLICGLRQMLFCDLQTGGTWLYEYPGSQRAWLAGGSLLYTRDFWRRSPFPNIQVGEDARFVWAGDVNRLVVIPDYRFYVAMIHPGNTSHKDCRGSYWSRWSEDLRQIMGEDMLCYQPLAGCEMQNGGAAMKLNLGCCDAPMPGFVNVDISPGPGIEVADLRRAWPWPAD